MILTDGTPAYDVWKSPPDPSYLKLFLFHVENPYNVSNNAAKPHLKEMGPYVFR